MADEKTFSESEHFAILADRVATETAALTAERDQLATSITELENKLDVETTAKTAAEARAVEAEKALADFKAEVETAREQAAKKDERVAKVREVASHLSDEFFDDTRVTRIVAMSDEIFEGYLADLSEASKGAPKSTTSVPRETAMAGQGAAPATTSAAANFFLRRYLAPTEG